MKNLLLIIGLSIICINSLSQNIDSVIVEIYHIATASEAAGDANLSEGDVTYRIFLDMAPNYELQAVYASASHSLIAGTTNHFYNEPNAGVSLAQDLMSFALNLLPNLYYDSWWTIGGFSSNRQGVLLSEDTSDGIVDGYITSTVALPTVLSAFDMSLFGSSNGSGPFSSNTALMYVEGGITGPTSTNRVLIGQFTTSGNFSFELNVQIRKVGTLNPENYVAKNPISITGEIHFPGLKYPDPIYYGCTNSSACNYDPTATANDGSCLIPEPHCWACSGDTLVMIDSNSNNIPDCDEIYGCTNSFACNYDPAANVNNGSCVIEITNCIECDGYGGWTLIDTDGDGVCDANEITGCMDTTACNYDPTATNQDLGMCNIPVDNCTQCSGDTLELIDDDGDGICNANEIPGCTSSTACNYEPLATDDDNSCIEPEADCWECNASNTGLVIIDTDGDGICDADDTLTKGLKRIILEKYYLSDDNDATDTYGGRLADSSATYRIYADLNEGFKLIDVYGDANHSLIIGTTTKFFNNEAAGKILGNSIDASKLDENTLALDSWVTIGGASDSHLGIRKFLDSDGSIVGGVNNDGGSASIPGGLLVNNDPNFGIPLSTSDGLTSGASGSTVVTGLDISMFDNENDTTELNATSGSWSVSSGIQGPTTENEVLIGQFTSNGSLYYELNITIESSTFGTQKYVSRNPVGTNEYLDTTLRKQKTDIPGCTSPTACNYNSKATLDDGSCLEPIANCLACNASNDSLLIIDDDGDGICNADEILGCTSPTACNYESFATDDDGSCVEPRDNCIVCDSTNINGYVMVDDDDDGICNADEGCLSSTACNYDPRALDDDGSCVEPMTNCITCNGDGTWTVTDTDGDGICDALEIAGCTNSVACNYNKNATDDDGSCLVPVFGCTYCSGDTLDCYDNVPTGGNGVCDCDDVPGCMDPIACNYNPDATYEDESTVCLIPVTDCWECSADSLSLVMVDANDDGCPDCEICGCTNFRACNYNPNATYSLGDCYIPDPDCEECDGDTIKIKDWDEDNIADCEDDTIKGLQNIIVEVYYIADSNDAADTDGGELATGSVTYRIYVDMCSAYSLMAVFSKANHPTILSTDTYWFNNTDRGGTLGNTIKGNKVDNNTVALDSWFTLGSATDGHWGVLKSEDTDGSLINGNLLLNDVETMGVPLTSADGLMSNPATDIKLSVFDISIFDKTNSFENLNTTTGLMYVEGNGLKGLTPSNTVLIGQFTTNGKFEGELNVLIKVVDTTNGYTLRSEEYVPYEASGDEINFEGLSFSFVPGCTNPEACNYDPSATLDNGTCVLPDSCIICNGDGTWRYNDSCLTYINSNKVGNSFVKVYPNPAQNELILEFSGTSQNTSYAYFLIDITGKMVMQNETNLFGASTVHLNVSTLTPGMYYLQVKRNDGGVVNKLIIKE